MSDLADALRRIQADFLSSPPQIRSMTGSISRAGTADASRAIQLAARSFDGEADDWRERTLELTIERAEGK